MILLLRANHANEFELQNYVPIAQKLHIEVITSQHPLTSIPLPSTTLWSPTDLPDLLLRRQLLNRLIGGEQWLIGLENIVVEKSNGSNNRTIIHTAETYTPYTHQAVELRREGIIKKLVCTCWETIPHANEKFARFRKWKADAYKYVDLFHTPTVRAKNALVAEGVDPNKIMVIPYGVDLTRFSPQNSKANKRPLVLTVARLEKQKGMENLEQVAESLPQYDFLVVGRGTYSPRGSNISVSSFPYSEIHQIYQKADLFFLPSRTSTTWEEQYGMALIEALACGLPIIASDSGAISEVLGDAGITYPVCDITKISELIFSVLNNKLRLKELSDLSLLRAQSRYDSVQVATQIAKLYN
jgi:glycosyltransferase involved in cell wall biosynthesis